MLGYDNRHPMRMRARCTSLLALVCACQLLSLSAGYEATGGGGSVNDPTYKSSDAGRGQVSGHAHATIQCVLENTRSAEDLLVLPLLMRAARRASGTFVEIGGYNGEEGSQTWLLEKCFGWSGTLIEASPINYAALTQAPRPRSRLVHSAVCKPAGHIDMLVGDGVSSVSGQASTMTEFFREQWGFRHKNKTARVPCRPLPHLVGRAARGDPITYLSLDVEGAEEAVLDSLDPNAPFPFSVVLVEINRVARSKTSQFTPSSQRVMARLERAGLVRLPIASFPGSENGLYARPELGDPRYTGREVGEPLNVSVAALRAQVATSLRELTASPRKLSTYSILQAPHLGGTHGAIVRATHALLAMDHL